MQPKNVSTIRVSQLAPGTREANLLQFFGRNKLLTASCLSLCPITSAHNERLTATVTFNTPSEAKKALSLDGQHMGDSKLSVERDFRGFTVLASPQEPSVDIIAIHGLNGHAYGTWAFQPEGNTGVEAMWLRDFLPYQFPQARIIVYGYNSTLLGPNTSVSSVKDFASDLLERILDDKRHAQDVRRPLIFICHSLGGLVVKQAIVTAHNCPDRYPDIEASIQAIIFLATPHGGSRAANIGLSLSNIATLAFQRPSKQLLQALKVESELLSDLSKGFLAVHKSFHIVSFYERRKTSMLNTLIVDEEASRLGVQNEIVIPLDATHSGICKFREPADPSYLLVLAQIRRCLGDTSKIGASLGEPSQFLGRADTSGSPLVERAGVCGLFVVTASPNQNFQGRRSELKRLDRLLTSRKHTGTSYHGPIVALHGLGGIGKTQLATQYVFGRKAKDPTSSTFWISARSNNEFRAGLRLVAETLRLQADGREDTDSIFARLKTWMASPESGQWLLIIDNYDDIQQIEFDRHVPAEIVGSILITTRDRKIIGPVANAGLFLGSMEESDAKQLFLRVSSVGEAEVDACSDMHHDDQVLKQILRELQYFPLAIDQAASFIRENAPITLQEYLRYLEPRSLNREKLMRFKQARPEYPESVMTTWEISLEYLNKSNPRASRILQLLGFLNNVPIPETLLTSTLRQSQSSWYWPTDMREKLAYLEDDVGFRMAIGALSSLSLVDRNPIFHTLSIHPLVHEWIRVRLNADRRVQAEWTSAAGVILFKTFPSERLVDPHEPWPDISSSQPQVNTVIKHITNVLQNFQDYAGYSEKIPVECYLLCEILILTGFARKSLYLPEETEKLLWKLDRATISIMPRLGKHLTPLAMFIHRSVMWLTKQGRRQGSDKTRSQIAEVLTTLQMPDSCNHSVVLLTMILTCTMFDVLTVDDDDTPSKSLIGVLKISASRNRERQMSSRRLLFNLHNAMDPLTKEWIESWELQWTHFIVKQRLMYVSSPDEYQTTDGLQPSDLLSSSRLSHLTLEERSSHFNRMGELLWQSKSPKDFEGLRVLFSEVYAQWKIILLKEHRSAVEETELQSTMMQPSSAYISSSFGRSTDYDSMFLIDLITPLDYIWSITPAVALEISDPQYHWRVYKHGDHSTERKISKLDPSLRRYAEELYLRMRRLYNRIVMLGHYEKYTDVDSVGRHFKTDDVNYTSVQIWINLGEWSKASRLLLDWLHCRSIISFCDDQRHFPWTGPPTSATIKRQSNEEGQTMAEPLYVGRHVGKGNVLRSRGVSGGDLLDNLYVGGWEIPMTCRFIFNIRVDDVIAMFITVASSQHRLTKAESEELRAKLQGVEAFENHAKKSLSRLELIYRLSQKYIYEIHAKTPTGRRIHEGSTSLHKDSRSAQEVESSDIELSDTEDQELDSDDDDLKIAKDVDVFWEW